MTDLNLKLIVSANPTEAQKALVGLQRRIAGLRSAASANGALGDVAKPLKAGVDSISVQLQRLQNLTGGLVAVAGVGQLVRGLVEVGDQYKLLQARIGLVTESQRGFNAASAGLFDIAQRTRQPLESVTDLFVRLQPALQAVGKSQGDTLQITESVSKALALSGASAAASAGALTQFAQALGAGALRGDEFNSVNEAAPRLMQALADGLGVPRAALRSYAEEGLLSAELVTGALASQRDRLDAEFAQLPQTVSASLTQLKNTVAQAFGGFDASAGLTAALASGISAVSDNLDRLQLVAVATGAVLAGRVAQGSATMLTSLVANARQAAINRVENLALAQSALQLAQAENTAAAAALAHARASQVLTPSAATLAAAEAAAATSAATLAAAQRGVAAATAQASLAARLGGGVLGALGGPVGAIVTVLGLAATAWTAVGNESTRAAERSEDAAQRIQRALTDTLLDGASASRKQVSDQQGVVNREQADLAAARVKLDAFDSTTPGRRSGARETLVNDVASAENRLFVAQQLLDRAVASYEASKAEAEAVKKKFAGIVAAGGKPPKGKTAAEGDDLSAATRDSIRNAIGDESDLQQQVQSILTPVERFRRELAAINLEAREGRLDEVARRAGLTVEEVRNRRLLQAAQKLPQPDEAEIAGPAERAKDSISDLAVFAEQGARNIQDAFAQFLFDPLEGGLKGFLVSFANTLRQAAAQAASSSILKAVFGGLANSGNGFLKAFGQALGGVAKVGAGGGAGGASAGGSLLGAGGIGGQFVAGLADGGLVSGPGSSTSDSIAARLSNGEFVVKAAAVRRVGVGFLNSLNRDSAPGFAEGGLVQSGTARSSVTRLTGRFSAGGDTYNIPVDARGATSPQETAAAVQRGVLAAFAQINRANARGIPVGG